MIWFALGLFRVFFFEMYVSMFSSVLMEVSFVFKFSGRGERGVDEIRLVIGW